ncbi:hypothetical protein HOF92_06835 [bacterium]|nr:hypothetical protein [bacterium]
MTRDLIWAHFVLQLILFGTFKNPHMNLSFLFGGMISLGNLHLMVRDCESLRLSGSSKRMLGGFGFRLLLMAVVVGLALSLQRFHPYALLAGLFTLQFSFAGRQLLWLAGTAVNKGSH